MSEEGRGATVAKRRLSRKLTELRIANGYTANQVCDRLNWGRGKVGRFEANTWVRPEMSDIRDLLRLYNASESEAAELESLAMAARGRAWWREYADNEFPGYEGDASRISSYLPLILPGLLQTPAYMEAQLRVGPRSSAWRNRAVGARLRRQEILDRTEESQTELIAVITEASLLYRWGGHADRVAQIEHLAEMSQRPNIEIRILTLAGGPHPCMTSALHVFDFQDDEPSLVFLENDTSVQEVSKPDEVNSYKATFGRVREVALKAADTTTFLEQLAETME